MRRNALLATAALKAKSQPRKRERIKTGVKSKGLNKFFI